MWAGPTFMRGGADEALRKNLPRAHLDNAERWSTFEHLRLRSCSYITLLPAECQEDIMAGLYFAYSLFNTPNVNARRIVRSPYQRWRWLHVSAVSRVESEWREESKFFSNVRLYAVFSSSWKTRVMFLFRLSSTSLYWSLEKRSTPSNRHNVFR